MALNRQRRLEEGSTDDYGSESNTNLNDELTASALARGAGEMIVIRTLQRFIRPIFVPIFRPLIRQLVKEEIDLAKREVLGSRENPENKASTSVLKRLKLQFRNRIALPVFTGMPLLGEGKTPIAIALVDALTEQIVNIGTESTAKLEIRAFQVGDDDNSCTFEDFQARILSEKQGRRILQGNTCLQLKEGIGSIGRISFTHNSEHTKNGSYRLGAIVVDAALMNQVEVAWTETFLIKDRRHTYHEKHAHPCLCDKVCHLQQISYKGNRFKQLRDAEVMTVRDLLILLYTDSKQLEDILGVKASSKIWNEIINNAQASKGMFLYLDPSNKGKPGVVLDVKLQLKAIIIEPQRYMPVNHLSDQQKVDSQNLVKFASEHLKMLPFFEDEASLEKHIQSVSGFTATNKSLRTSKAIDGPTKDWGLLTTGSMNNSTFPMCESKNHAPTITSQSQRGKEKVSFNDDKVYSGNDYQGHILSHQPNLQGPNQLNFGTATEPGTSSQSADSLLETCARMNWEELQNLLSYDCNSLNKEWHPVQENSGADVVMLAAQAVSVCTIAQTRWTKVSKLLRRNSFRERISLSERIQAPKRQRCC